jgi:hypothetical protein
MNTFRIMTTRPKTTINMNTKNTYSFRIFCKNGNANVRTSDEIQFAVTQTAKAELRAFCLKHSAAYKNGIGPKPIAKLIMNIIMQAIDKYEYNSPCN